MYSVKGAAIQIRAKIKFIPFSSCKKCKCSHLTLNSFKNMTSCKFIPRTFFNVYKHQILDILSREKVKKPIKINLYHANALFLYPLKTPQNQRYKCPANIYLIKFNNRNTRKRCEMCSKLTIKAPERRQ